jgi:hypothetical protein
MRMEAASAAPAHPSRTRACGFRARAFRPALRRDFRKTSFAQAAGTRLMAIG